MYLSSYKVSSSSCSSSYEVWTKEIYERLNVRQHWGFFHTVTQQLSCLIRKNPSYIISGCSTSSNCCKTTSNGNPTNCPSPDLVTLGRHGHWKWYKIAEVNVASKHRRYERVLFESYCRRSEVKVFGKQDSGLAVHLTEHWWHRSICYSHT